MLAEEDFLWHMIIALSRSPPGFPDSSSVSPVPLCKPSSLLISTDGGNMIS